MIETQRAPVTHEDFQILSLLGCDQDYRRAQKRITGVTVNMTESRTHM